MAIGLKPIPYLSGVIAFIAGTIIAFFVAKAIDRFGAIGRTHRNATKGILQRLKQFLAKF